MDKETKQAHKLIHSVISTTIALHYNEELTHTNFYDKELKHKGNLFLKALFKKEKFFESLAEQVEDPAFDVYNAFYDYINIVKSVSIPEMGELTAIIQAYRKDKSSILGITKKILK